MSVETLQPVAPSPEGSDPLAGLGRAAELGLFDPNLMKRLEGMPAFGSHPLDSEVPADASSLTIGAEERYVPNAELITDISRTVGEFVLGHATDRDASDAHEQARLASGLSALGNILTQKDTAELMAAKASVAEATKHPLAIDSILAEHAVRQDAIRRSSEFTMTDKDRKKRRKTNGPADLLQDAIDRADADQN